MRRVQPIMKSYDWGMKNLVSSFITEPVEKVAEIWWGSHPNGCLLDKDSMEPIHNVPLLLKLLFVNKPLSLQIHPNPEQIRQHPKIFTDPLPKPEIIIAITKFEILCGFLDMEQIHENISPIPFLCFYQDFQKIFQLPNDEIQNILYHTREYSLKQNQQTPYSVFLSLYELYPTDPAILAPFYMNHVCLSKDQALIIPASQPHCYLSGQGIECMPCSDNIVRCGLTTKHCNIDLFFQLCVPQPIIMKTTHPYHHSSLDPYFSLSNKPCFGKKNSIILVLDGEGQLNHQSTKQGESWILEKDQPITFDNNLHVMIAMPCINKNSKMIL